MKQKKQQKQQQLGQGRPRLGRHRWSCQAGRTDGATASRSPRLVRVTLLLCPQTVTTTLARHRLSVAALLRTLQFFNFRVIWALIHVPYPTSCEIFHFTEAVMCCRTNRGQSLVVQEWSNVSNLLAVPCGLRVTSWAWCPDPEKWSALCGLSSWPIRSASQTLPNDTAKNSYLAVASVACVDLRNPCDLEMSCGKRPTSAGTAFAALWRSLWAHWRRKNLNGTRHLGSWRWSRFSTPRCNAWPRWCSTKGYKPTLGWTPRLPARPYKPVQIQPRGKGIGFLKVQIVRSCGTWWRAGSWWSLWRSTNAVLALFVCTKYVMWLPNSAMFL